MRYYLDIVKDEFLFPSTGKAFLNNVRGYHVHAPVWEMFLFPSTGKAFLNITERLFARFINVSIPFNREGVSEDLVQGQVAHRLDVLCFYSLQPGRRF